MTLSPDNYSVITVAKEAVGVQWLHSFTSVVCSCWSLWWCVAVGPGLGAGSEDGDEGKDPIEQGAWVGHQ